MNKNTVTHRVIAMLNREELEFLDKLGKDALFSTGHKLSYNEILECLVDFAREIGVSGKNIDTKEKLKGIMLQQMPKASGQHQ